MERAMKQANDHTVGSGNVFADLGFAEPEAELLKADLAHRITTLVERSGWTQAEAATAMGVDQAKVSAIVRGRLGGFSAERLMRLLTRLGHDVRISVAPNPSSTRSARITVLPLPDLREREAEPTEDRLKV